MDTTQRKQQAWDDMLAQYSQATDALETPIDAGILETVVILNLLGVPTDGSCEGHLDHGSGAPYIDVYIPYGQYSKLKAQAEEALNRAQKGQESHSLSEQEIQRLWARARSLQRELSMRYLSSRSTLIYYLSRFYSERQVPYDRQLSVQGLTLQGIPGDTRLESQGASILLVWDDETRVRKLQEYQAEMQEFTTFLKQSYFANE